MSENEIKSEYFDCSCFHSEHGIKFDLDAGFDDIFPELYLTVFMNRDELPWYARLSEAFKYLFKVGKPCRFGHFGNWTLRQGDVDRLRGLLDKYEVQMAAWKVKNGVKE